MQQNVEIIREGYEAFNERGLEGILAFLDPEIEWRTRELGVEGHYRGHAGVRKFFADVVDGLLEDVELEPEELTQVGDQVVAVVYTRARGKASGVEVEERVAHVWKLREGKAIRLQAYSTREEALEGVGLGRWWPRLRWRMRALVRGLPAGR